MNKTTKLNEKIVELASLPSKSTLAHKKFTDRRNFSEVSANSLLVEKYLKKLDWKLKENSNMTYSVQGLNNYLASEICKNYWLEKIYNENIKIAHESGDLHIHDLNMISVYCVGWDLKNLLIEGFTGVNGKVKCAPPKHFRSALGQAVNFLYTMQGVRTACDGFYA